ncbi:MAG: panC [Gammaproteobacteria bacterium]|jgi:pantoate--beta-alanine ligase|nr:panC [Gammaproteobacteria bacterium]
MNSYEHYADWLNARNGLPKETRIGLVPTMGALHTGHKSLLEKARRENDFLVLSIFVNPTQFNDLNDYQHYPRTLESDRRIAEECNVDALLIPSEKDMYPYGNDMPIITHHPASQIMEGKVRPGHFNGVLTVVMKLLQWAKPTCVYFGEKDFQQYLLICELVKNYFLDVEVIGCETMREASGLPLSSRNQRFDSEQIKLAHRFAELLRSGSYDDLAAIQQRLEAAGLIVEYLEKHFGRLFVAVECHGIRLIDNFAV